MTSVPDYDTCRSRARIAHQQEHVMNHAAAYAAGIGEYGCANACYRVAELFRQKAVYWNTQACLTQNPDYPRKKRINKPVRDERTQT